MNHVHITKFQIGNFVKIINGSYKNDSTWKVDWIVIYPGKKIAYGVSNWSEGNTISGMPIPEEELGFVN